MHPARNFLIVVVILLGCQSLVQAQTTDERRLSVSKEVMEKFAKGDVASVREQFSADLKDSVSESDLKGAQEDLAGVAGAFQSHISQTTRTAQGEQVYISRSQFEHYKVELRLTFNDANEITDLRIAPISDLSSESMEAAARAVTDLLRQEQFKEVTDKFSEQMKESMPADRLAASWAHVMMHLGPFKNIRTARKDPEYDRVDVRCEFENGPMIVRILFDPSGKIAGLWMLPAEPEKDSQI